MSFQSELTFIWKLNTKPTMLPWRYANPRMYMEDGYIEKNIAHLILLFYYNHLLLNGYFCWGFPCRSNYLLHFKQPLNMTQTCTSRQRTLPVFDGDTTKLLCCTKSKKLATGGKLLRIFSVGFFVHFSVRRQRIVSKHEH